MTVGELIAKLQTYSPELEVYASDAEWGLEEPKPALSKIVTFTWQEFSWFRHNQGIEQPVRTEIREPRGETGEADERDAVIL